MRTFLQGKTFVEEVAFHVATGLQRHRQRADRPDKAATDHHLLGNNATLKLCVLAEHKREAMDVA
jgi:hypothetical protein